MDTRLSDLFTNEYEHSIPVYHTKTINLYSFSICPRKTSRGHTAYSSLEKTNRPIPFHSLNRTKAGNSLIFRAKCFFFLNFIVNFVFLCYLFFFSFNLYICLLSLDVMFIKYINSYGVILDL